MTHKIFKKEYLDLYSFYTNSEEQFIKYPTITKITTGFCYRGGIKPVYCLISAFPSEEEALSTIDEKPISDVLKELRQEVLGAHGMDVDYFVYMINCKLREIKRRNER